MGTGGSNTREILEDGIPKGWEGECPYCNETNRALYDEEGKYGEVGLLIHWPNKEIGTWCKHASGCYVGDVLILFVFVEEEEGHLDKDLVLKYLSDATEEELIEVATHIADCSLCRKRIQALDKFTKNVSYLIAHFDLIWESLLAGVL